MNENKKAAPGRDGKRATTASTLNIAQNNITMFHLQCQQPLPILQRCYCVRCDGAITGAVARFQPNYRVVLVHQKYRAVRSHSKRFCAVFPVHSYNLALLWQNASCTILWAYRSIAIRVVLLIRVIKRHKHSSLCFLT